MYDEEANEMVVNALVRYLDESLGQESTLREILEKSGHNDPAQPLEVCVSNLVRDYLRLMVG